jgi:His-Xaa-Ser system protein HxsD
LIARIRNEVIDQDLRSIIAKETSNVRTLILANAFSNTGLIES